MSRSTPVATNPSKRFFQWSGSKGIVTYYDKEKAENVEIKLPFEFMVLDELSTMTGWDDKNKSGFWSNEVRSLANEDITVRSKGGIEQVGKYADLGDVKAKGAKYAKSIYITYYVDGELVICNFKASGAALTAWIEFSNKVGRMDQQSAKASIVGSEEATKGATKYQVPVFDIVDATKEEVDLAFDLDGELQDYLGQYLAKNKTQEPSIEAEQDVKIEDLTDEGDDEVDLNDIPFN